MSAFDFQTNYNLEGTFMKSVQNITTHFEYLKTQWHSLESLSEETLVHMCEQMISHEVTQLSVKYHCVCFATAAFTTAEEVNSS